MGKPTKDEESTNQDEKSTKEKSSAKASEDIQTEDLATRFERLQDSDADFQKFLTMLAAAGDIIPEQSLSIDEMQSIISKFAAWKEADMPPVSMPKLTEKEVPIPSLIIRAKHLGKQFMWWRDTKGREYGIERIPMYRKIKDLDPSSATFNQEIDDIANILDMKSKYLQEYNREEGIKLVKLGADMNPEGLECIFKFGNQDRGFTVGQKDFNVPGPNDPRTFDDIIALHKRNDYVPT